jgi:hypothetical protein
MPLKTSLYFSLFFFIVVFFVVVLNGMANDRVWSRRFGSLAESQADAQKSAPLNEDAKACKEPNAPQDQSFDMVGGFGSRT